ISQLTPKSHLISSDNIFDATQYVAQTWRYFPAYGFRMLTPHFARVTERYDVVLASTQLIVEVYPALVIARQHKAKLVAKVHHVLAAQEKRVGAFDRLFLWSERKTTRWLSERGDLVICGTKFVESDYKKLESKLGLKHAPTAASGYGVDLAKMPDSSNASKNYDVVHLGRLHEHKGVFHLAPLWKKVVEKRPEAKLLVIGEGPHRPRVEQMFRDLGISENVRFTGGIPEGEKDKLISESKIGLSLSFEEGWGLSINEFLAAAIPVVAYALPIFDVVFPNQLYGVKVGDIDGAANSILRLLGADAERREVGQRGRQFVMQYDYRNVAKSEFALLENLFR
ncbi:MAG TPA: glycosyltransferase family 4 protein, partial [Candidatus Kapabacteria bacterium]|nr:glycosyltransferase family 4 protein [Candidatus Kapabacteria bacterium]